MGVDLRLLPFDCDQGGFAYSHTVLDCERRRELWDAIAEIEKAHGQNVPEGFTSFSGRAVDGETGYGRTNETPYGTALKYIVAADLVKLADHEAVQDNEKNRAIWAFLAQLGGDTKVALYWH